MLFFDRKDAGGESAVDQCLTPAPRTVSFKPPSNTDTSSRKKLHQHFTRSLLQVHSCSSIAGIEGFMMDSSDLVHNHVFLKGKSKFPLKKQHRLCGAVFQDKTLFFCASRTSSNSWMYSSCISSCFIPISMSARIYPNL